MISASETILSILPGQSEDVRTVVALRHCGADTLIEMRQESFSQAVGWFVQSRIELSGEQVSGLRQTLGMVPHRVARPSRVAATHRMAPQGRDAAGDTQHPATLAFPHGPRSATA